MSKMNSAGVLAVAPSNRGSFFSALAAIGLAGSALAQSQFSISPNAVLTNGGSASSYSGPSTGGFDLRGAVLDGGLGAYNLAGGLFFDPSGFDGGVAPAGLQITRRTDTLSNLNVFRWVMTFTNTTAATITTPVAFWTQIGYDSTDYTDVANTPFRFITFENRVVGTIAQADIPGDPVIGMMHGNNGFTLNNITWARQVGAVNNALNYRNVNRQWNLSLAPGQSQTVMFADFLAYTLDANGNAGGGGSPDDITVAWMTTSNYLGNALPLFQGLTPDELASISNWSISGVIPTPGAAGLLGLSALVATRRRRSR